MYIFVYGTLKRGFGNHHILEDAGAKFIAEAETYEKNSLYVSGLPFMKRGGGQTHVKGEVYDVPSDQVYKIDRLEGHPDFYTRSLGLVSLMVYPTTIKSAHMYFYNGNVDEDDKVMDGNYY